MKVSTRQKATVYYGCALSDTSLLYLSQFIERNSRRCRLFCRTGLIDPDRFSYRTFVLYFCTVVIESIFPQ